MASGNEILRTPWALGLVANASGDEILTSAYVTAGTVEIEFEGPGALDAAQYSVAAVNAYPDLTARLREAYVALAFAFNRLDALPKSRDKALARDIGKVRGRIEAVLKPLGEA